MRESFCAATQLANTLNQNVIISIEGRTDRVGTERENLLVSQARAESIRARLIRRQIEPAILRTQALGATQNTHNQEGRLSERRVSFKVTLE